MVPSTATAPDTTATEKYAIAATIFLLFEPDNKGQRPYEILPIASSNCGTAKQTATNAMNANPAGESPDTPVTLCRPTQTGTP